MKTENRLYIENFEGLSREIKVPRSFTLACAYFESRDQGCELINFNEAIFNSDVESIFAALKDVGVKEFTISSGFCGMIETIGKFVKLGCRVKDSIESKRLEL